MGCLFLVAYTKASYGSTKISKDFLPSQKNPITFNTQSVEFFLHLNTPTIYHTSPLAFHYCFDLNNKTIFIIH